MGFPLLVAGGAQARKVHGQDHAVQRALTPAALQPADKVVPQPVLDLTGGALTLVLAQQFTVRVDQYAVVTNPPVKAERIAVTTNVTGDVGQAVRLPRPLNQAAFAGI